MTPEDNRLQRVCLSLLHNYKRSSINSLKRYYRNELFKLLNDKLILWIRSSIRNKSEQEIISLSWDGFERALKDWKGTHNNVYQHFKRYTVYEILNILEEKQVTMRLTDELIITPSPEESIIAMIMIKDLRESLTGRNRDALDDLLMGEDWNKGKEPSRNAYNARRDLLREIIKGMIT